MINNIRQAIRSLGQRGRHNIMKIASLALGLAVGLVLIAKVCYEQSFDTFYPDLDRIYRIYEVIPRDEGLKSWSKTPGGIAVRMREMMPEIESSTRFTYVGGGTFTMTESRKKLGGVWALTDSCWFDVLPRPILQGDPKEVLSRPGYVMVSDKVAENIGGDVIGKTLTFDGNEKAVMTIGGVFKKIPDNASLGADVLISMPSIGQFTWDGSMNMVGNDRYSSFVKLVPGADISRLKEQIPQFINTYLPVEELKKAGVDLRFDFQSITAERDNDESIRSMIYMLSLIAFALIFVAVMNYILITVSSVIGRSKEVAVRKCYGASAGNINGIIFAEAFVHVVIALLVAVFLLFTFQDFISQLLGTPIERLLMSRSMLVILGVSAGVLLVTGLLPGSLYARIPVAAAFRNYRESKRIWKLALLFIQFTAAIFLVILLFVVNRQYHRMTNDDPGYAYDNLAYIPLNIVSDTTQRRILLEELQRLPEVEMVSHTYDLPIHGSSGDNVMLPGEDKRLFNCADQYYVGANFFELMEIPIIDGRAFNPNLGMDEEVMISRRFAEYMERTAGWTGSPVGKQICVTSHNEGGKAQTICGVYEDYRIGSISDNDVRPAAVFYSPRRIFGPILVKYHRLSPDALKKTEETLARLVPDKELHVYSYPAEMEALYADTLNFRNAVLAGGLITLAILLIGLVGYTTDEVNRRRKEIAVRRINGALMGDIQRIFLRDVAKMLVPAIVLGVPLAWKVAVGWQEQFSEKVSLSWYLFVGGVLLISAIIFTVSGYNVHRIAQDNPANSLRSE